MPPEASGKAVRVAVVDSGINAHHSHVRHVAGGVRIARGENGSLEFDPATADNLGHGTAIAGVIRAKAPGVELYSVKVFEATLWTHSDVLAGAIRWCADQGMRVVNLSLGTSVASHRELLQRACIDAVQSGVVLVAAGQEGAQEFLPAGFRDVIGVAGDERCGWDDYYYCGGETFEFRAHPWPRPLPRLPQHLNFRGHSFAAAHITALVARIVELAPRASCAEVRSILVDHAATLAPHGKVR